MNRRDRRAAQKMMKGQRAIKQDCAECAACCTELGVQALHKQAGERCVHLVDGAKPCSMYPVRPDECRAYQCMWSRGMPGIPEMRPDRVGVIFEVSTGGPFGKPFVVARWIEGCDEAKAQAAIDSFASHQLVYVMRGNGREFQGPAALVADAERYAARKLPMVRL